MTSLRLLRFAGLMLLLGSVASASAQTVAERWKNEPGFRVYPVTFAVTATTPPVIRVQEVGVPKGSPKIDNVPDAFIKAAKKKILAEPPKPKMKMGSRSRSSRISFTFRGIPMSSSLTWTSRSTSNHDI